jgi:hypothetical protein
MLDYEPQIVSDFSALHRIDDWRAVSPARLFGLAEQLAYYAGGAVRGRVSLDLPREREGDGASRAEPRGARVRHQSDSVALAELAGEGWATWKRGG